jgi:hypothetical protein
VLSFFQAAAPTGWTQVATQNNKGIRIVSGTGGGTGGTIAFSTLFSTATSYSGSINITSGQVGNTSLSVAQMPSHSHTFPTTTGVGGPALGPQSYGPQEGAFGTDSAGGDATHTHSLAGVAANGNFTSNFDLQYIDMILASKN